MFDYTCKLLRSALPLISVVKKKLGSNATKEGTEQEQLLDTIRGEDYKPKQAQAIAMSTARGGKKRRKR